MSAWPSGNAPLTHPSETVPETSRRSFRRFLVVTALRDEAVTFCRGAGPSFYPLSLGRALQSDPGGDWRERGGVPVIYSGPGSWGLDNLGTLFSGGDVASVLFLGFAGGMTPSLVAGDILVGTRVMKAGYGSYPVFPPDFLSLRYRTGTILSVGHPVGTPAEKVRLQAETGGDVVDMESAGWLACASRHSVQGWVVRVVSDAAGETLPPEMMAFVDSQGETSLRGIVKTLLMRPAVIPAILSLVRGMVRAHISLRDLGSLVSQHVESGHGPEGDSR